ncbi:MAG TPA: divergent polysaccharide deacetylase family protein [Methylomirabilota bacterium]|nr:divergent polysaccharide deacetylase family protein [Methylomirabilota bacterium]
MPRRFLSLLFLPAIALIFSGCGRQAPSSEEIRSITREMIAASHEAAGGRAEIGFRGQYGAREPDGGPPPLEADHIFITLPAGEQDFSVTAIQRALDRVAKSHHLARQPQPSTPGQVRFDYAFNGHATHSIHIVFPIRSAAEEKRSAQKTHPRLAIIFDDLGGEHGSAEALLALQYPLTVAVLPNLQYSAEIAEEAHRRGFEVMLHLPVESESGEKPEPQELRSGMSRQDVAALLDNMLESVPHAVGVNNHQGSRGTADPALMDNLMAALSARKLFFIDSRTTASTVAYQAAVGAGVPAASRNVFLDDVESADAVRAQIELAASDAKKNGFAIAIGHPHEITLQVVAEELPKLEAEGIRLVFASDLTEKPASARR